MPSLNNPVYICGDSFGSVDPEYSVKSWTELLADSLPVVNLSRICASNLQIALQVDRAMSAGADYIIYLATTSTRHDVEFLHIKHRSDLLDRYVDLQRPESQCDLTSYSSRSLDSTTRFNSHQLDLLKKYHSEFGNLDLDIYLNQTIIEAVINRLIHSKIKFCFDQGGFEHAKFGGKKKYFEKYLQYASAINIWDYALTNGLTHRPYHHITDAHVHQRIADYYYQKIINE
jgi:hypothetical protein